MSDPAATLPPFEVFRAGTHTAADGRTLSFSREDVAAIAAAYDPAVREAPIVAGHPKHDDPAWGWLERFEAQGDVLLAHPRQVDAAFAEMVRAGRFKHRSIMLLPPGAAGNPSATAHYPKHVGFLGAQPPAVSGLKPIAFGEEDADGVAFMEPWQQSALARLLQRMREWIIGAEGVEAADRVLPAYEIEDIGRQPSPPVPAAPMAAPAFSEPDPKPPAKEPEVPDNTATAELERQLAEERAARAAAEQRAAESAAAFSEREAADRLREDSQLLDRLVAEGRLIPALRADALAFLCALPTDAVEIAFSEGGSQPNARAAARALFGRLPKVVPFGEAAGSDKAIRAADPSDAKAIEREAAAFMERERREGREVSIAQAIQAVTQGATA